MFKGLAAAVIAATSLAYKEPTEAERASVPEFDALM